MAEVGTAFVTIAPSMRGFGSQMTKGIGGDVDKAGKTMGSKFGSALKVGAVAAVGAGVAIGKFLGDSLGEAREAAVIGARTENVIKKMGNASKITAKQVGDLAGAISLKTGIDDEAIQAGQNLLLTFGNVRNEAGKGNDIFNQTSRLMVDMSKAMGTDAKGSAIQLGKALNDPLKGLTALSRVGVSFSEGQKKQIESMVKAGDTLGAQKVILGELENQFGGAAAAMATPGEKVAVAWGNVKEQIGTSLLPVVDKLLNSFLKAMPTITRLVDNVGPAFQRVKGFLKPIVDGIRDMFAVFSSGKGPGQLKELQTTFSSVFGSIKTIVRDVVSIVRSVWGAFGGTIVKHARTFMRNILQIVKGGFDVIAGIFKVVASVLKGDWKGAWEGIKQILRGAWAIIKAVVKQGWATVKALFSIAGTVLKSVVSRMWDGISTLVGKGISKVVDLVKDLPDKIKGALGALGSVLYNAGQELIDGLIRGITAKLGALASKMSEVASKIKGFLPGSPVREGPLRSWNNTGPNGPGGLLVGMLADGLSNTDSIDRAMHRMSSRISVPRPSTDLAFAGGAGGGGRQSLRLVVGGREFPAYMEEIADGRIAGQFDLDDERRRANR